MISEGLGPVGSQGHLPGSTCSDWALALGYTTLRLKEVMKNLNKNISYEGKHNHFTKGNQYKAR